MNMQLGKILPFEYSVGLTFAHGVPSYFFKEVIV